MELHERNIAFCAVGVCREGPGKLDGGRLGGGQPGSIHRGRGVDHQHRRRVGRGYRGAHLLLGLYLEGNVEHVFRAGSRDGLFNFHLPAGCTYGGLNALRGNASRRVVKGMVDGVDAVLLNLSRAAGRQGADGQKAHHHQHRQQKRKVPLTFPCKHT
ncbi:hypothetical protein SDC9_172348 [bioreactor metagenome]|uniref:Uncharacterized protein n=1 Tax=bioreactor metagenome TaxID=1076179 RepID=A0A645GFX1_9ZZZZ